MNEVELPMPKLGLVPYWNNSSKVSPFGDTIFVATFLKSGTEGSSNFLSCIETNERLGLFLFLNQREKEKNK